MSSMQRLRAEVQVQEYFIGAYRLLLKFSPVLSGETLTCEILVRCRGLVWFLLFAAGAVGLGFQMQTIVNGYIGADIDSRLLSAQLEGAIVLSNSKS